MARITQKARSHAARIRAGGASVIDDVLEDDELGDVVSDTLGQIPLIGGLFGGGSKPEPAPAPASSGVDPATMAAAMASKTSGGSSGDVAVHHATEIAKRPTSTDLRNIVKDALASHAAKQTATALQTATQDRLATQHAERITKALAPQAAATHGGVQEQRLQAQATAEHNAIMRREARTREEADRYARLMEKLDTLVTRVTAMQKRLGVAEVVTGRAVDILGGRDALERHR